MDSTTWYPRLADVPGVEYIGPKSVRRPEIIERPTITSYDLGKGPVRHLSWKTQDGVTSQSPASRWAPRDNPRASPSPVPAVLQRLYEALELPAKPTDYHFAIMAVYEELWVRRREEPDVLPELERLCLLDVALIEAIPEIVRDPWDTGASTLHSPAFWKLMHLYEQNGFLEDALTIAKRGAALGQCPGEVERLTERIAFLQSEDAS